MGYLINIWIACKWCDIRHIGSRRAHRFQHQHGRWLFLNFYSILFYSFRHLRCFSSFVFWIVAFVVTFFVFLCITEIGRCSEHAGDINRNLKMCVLFNRRSIQFLWQMRGATGLSNATIEEKAASKLFVHSGDMLYMLDIILHWT